MFYPFKLKSPLGRSYNADLGDTLRTKKALKKLGLFETPPYGMTEFPDDPLFKGIEKFQKQHGLRRDGVMKPEGETAAKLGQVLAEEEKPHMRTVPNALGLSAEVGPGRANTPHDTFSVSRALAWAGFPHGRSEGLRGSPRNIDITDAVKRFQKRAGLKVDGWMRPYGETEKTLNTVLSSKVKALGASSNEEFADGSLLPDDEPQQQEVAGILFPPIVYKMAEFFGIALTAAWAWWKSLSEAQRQQLKRQMSEGSSGNGRDEYCDRQYDIDTQRCNEVTEEKDPAAGRRCHNSASERYAACLKGVPSYLWPPLDTGEY